MQRRSVLFPEPLAPIMLTTLPRGTSKDTPFSTASGPKLLCTSTTLIAGMLDTARSQWISYFDKEERMSDKHSDSKRDFLKGAARVGAAAGFAGAMAPREALAQMPETGIREDSSLAKIKKEGVMRVGFSQTGPWFYRDAKSGELGGIYKDAVERLAKELEVKVDWKEVPFANSTIGLRRGDYDLYGSSLTYTIPRALTVSYVGPLWSKGSLLLIHKDNAGKLKTAADLNDPSVRVSVTAGAREGRRSPRPLAQAKGRTTPRPGTLGAQAVGAQEA